MYRTRNKGRKPDPNRKLQCSECGDDKTAETDFRANACNANGFHHTCKACEATAAKTLTNELKATILELQGNACALCDNRLGACLRSVRARHGPQSGPCVARWARPAPCSAGSSLPICR